MKILQKCELMNEIIDIIEFYKESELCPKILNVKPNTKFIIINIYQSI